MVCPNAKKGISARSQHSCLLVEQDWLGFSPSYGLSTVVWGGAEGNAGKSMIVEVSCTNGERTGVLQWHAFVHEPTCLVVLLHGSLCLTEIFRSYKQPCLPCVEAGISFGLIGSGAQLLITDIKEGSSILEREPTTVKSHEQQPHDGQLWDLKASFAHLKSF